MKEKIAQIKQNAKEDIQKITDMQTLQEIKIKYLGKKCELTSLLKTLGTLSAEERPVIGNLVNETKQEIESFIKEKEVEFKKAEINKKIEKETIDITLPSTKFVRGSKHPLNRMIEKMEEYASRLGADCAFFIKNQPVFASGIGNIFEPVQLSLKGYYLVLVKPDIFVSTKEAYALVKPHKPAVSLKEIVRMPVETWRATMKNDFEESVFARYPEIAAIKDKLYDMGAIYASMSGSGSSVFGIFREQVEYVDEIFNGCFCRQRALE